MKRLIGQNLLALLCGTGNDIRGSAAPMFAVSALGLVTIIGVSFDYARLETARTSLQNASDATALAIVSDMVAGASVEDISDRARQQISAQVSSRVKDGLRDVGASASGTRVVIKSTASISLTFGGLVGQSEHFVETTTTADYGVSGSARKTEIALVLDVSNGMNDKEKLGALKKYTQVFVDTAQRISDNTDATKIALVPYAEHVKLDQNNRPAAWLKFSGENEKPVLSPEQLAKTQTDIKAANKLVAKATQQRIERMAWDGCVTDAKEPAVLAFDAVNQHPGVRCTSEAWQKNEANTIFPLTSKFDELKQQLANVQAEGCGNTTIGLAWGYGALLPQGPFGQAGAFKDKNTSKVMVLVSGSANSASRQFGICLGNEKREERMKSATLAACDKIKRAGIVIYTVDMVDGDSEVLKACATDPDKYMSLKTSVELAPAMDKIRKEILLGTAKVARLVK